MTGVPPAAGQTWDPGRYVREAGFVAELGVPLLDLLAPVAGEHILDLGCGDGRLTRRISDRGAQVVGVDASIEFVEAARVAGIDARLADGHDLRFGPDFDAVFSNAALHWMKRPDAVAAGVFGALKPGGRFVGECGGAGNVRTIRAALGKALAAEGVDAVAVDPWYFPTDAEYRDVLTRAGFIVEHIGLFPRPTDLPGSVADWLGVFGRAFLDGLDPAAHQRVVTQVTEATHTRLSRSEGGRTVWTADYVRLRFQARKPV